MECEFHYELAELRPSAAAEQQVRAEAGLLERSFGPMKRCEIAFDVRKSRSFPGATYHARIVADFPNHDSRIAGEASHGDLLMAIRSAFAALRADLNRGRTPPAPGAAARMSGHVVELGPGDGQALMLSEAGERLTLRRCEQNRSLFDGLRVGDRVWVTTQPGAGSQATGPILVHVVASRTFH